VTTNKKNLKTALVTGGTAGIGKSIATELAREGYQVAICGRRSQVEVDPLLKTLREITGEDCAAVYIQGDISEKSVRKSISQEIENRFQHLDLLVNNAGIAPKKRQDMLDLSEEDILDVLSINLIAPYLLTASLVPLLMKGDGESFIVNISSISAYTASINRAEYCISKAGVAMMTSLFAERLVDGGIRVFEIRPGIIKTAMTASVQETYDALIKEGLFPIKRWGEPIDVAKAVIGIAKGYHSYSTGEVINVDGGFHLRSL